MKKKYTEKEILNMAVGLLDMDPDADLDGDGKGTAADARLALRANAGLPEEGAAPAFTPDGVNAGDGESALSGKLRKIIVDRILGLSGESASSGTDPDALLKTYAPIYEDAAAKAAENAYGLLAARTGGYGSSYAVSAAAGVYDDVMKELADKRTELARLQMDEEKLSLQKQSAALSALFDAVGLLDKDEQTAYARSQDAVSLAFRAATLGDYAPLQALGFDLSEKVKEDKWDRAVLRASYGDYSALEALGVDVSALREKAALSKAETAAKYGDLSLLDGLGIDTGDRRYRDLLDVAAALAGFGDYSGLEALGVDLTKLKADDALERALSLAKYGDYSLLGSFTDNAAALRAKIPVSVQKGAENAYSYGGRRYLLSYLDRQVGYGAITEEDKKRIAQLLTGY